MSYFEAKMHQIRFHSAPQMSALENGKTTMQEYKQRYLYIFKMANKTGNSNKSSSRAHNRSS